MASLKLLASLALLVPGTASADAVDRWQGEVAEASSRFGVPAEWIRRVIGAESAGRQSWLGHPIVSPAGAMGLMQLMPGTWRDMRLALGLGTDPHDPHDNILAGTHYLRLMYDRFGYPGLFAAYNAGPARYADHLLTGRALPAETIAYSARVTSKPAAFNAISAFGEKASGSLAQNRLFAVGPGFPQPAHGDRARPAAGDIFVPLSASRPRDPGSTQR